MLVLHIICVLEYIALAVAPFFATHYIFFSTPIIVIVGGAAIVLTSRKKREDDSNSDISNASYIWNNAAPLAKAIVLVFTALSAVACTVMYFLKAGDFSKLMVFVPVVVNGFVFLACCRKKEKPEKQLPESAAEEPVEAEVSE